MTLQNAHRSSPMGRQPMTNAELTAEADAILLRDREETGEEHGILTDGQMKHRRSKEVYSATGTVESFTPGVFSRKPCTIVKKPEKPNVED
jgi:hypothetical protein